MSKLSVPVIGSLHFLKISPLIFQLSFKITNCHHETGFSCCLRLSAGFDQFRPHFALGMGLEIFLFLLPLENSSFEVMPRAASDGRNLSSALPICLHRHTTGDGNAALLQLPWSLSSPCPSARQDYSLLVLQYLLEAPDEMACHCAGCFMHFPGRDSLFPKETTIYKPRHTGKGPLSLFWKQRTDTESTTTSTVGGRTWDPSEYMPLPCAGSLLRNANNPSLKSPVLAVPIVREGEAVSEGTRGYVSS